MKTINSNISVFIVDTIGELIEFYQMSEIVFLGGSLNPKVNGHNPMEAAQQGR